MLTKNTRKIIKYLKKKNGVATCREVEEGLSLSRREAASAYLHLESEMYAMRSDSREDYVAHRQRTIYLLERGKYHIRFSIAEAGVVFLKSILCPIIVAFITTMLTTFFIK